MQPFFLPFRDLVCRNRKTGFCAAKPRKGALSPSQFECLLIACDAMECSEHAFNSIVVRMGQYIVKKHWKALAVAFKKPGEGKAGGLT